MMVSREFEVEASFSDLHKNPGRCVGRDWEGAWIGGPGPWRQREVNRI